MENNEKEEYTEYVKAVLLWGQIKAEYEKGNILISVSIQLAQKFLINTSTLALLCSLAITIIFPIIIAIFSATTYGVLGGIAYSIVFIIVYFLIYGQASVNLNRTFDMLMILSAIIIFISVSMTFELAIPLYMSLVACWLIYLYVYYIGKTIINKYVLKSFDLFTFLVSTNIVHVQDRNGNVLV